MKFRWYATCASCDELLATKPKEGPYRPEPGRGLMAGVKCESCNGPTPIIYNRLRLVVQK